jgi:hypothetical protein
MMAGGESVLWDGLRRMTGAADAGWSPVNVALVTALPGVVLMLIGRRLAGPPGSAPGDDLVPPVAAADQP